MTTPTTTRIRAPRPGGIGGTSDTDETFEEFCLRQRARISQQPAHPRQRQRQSRESYKSYLESPGYEITRVGAVHSDAHAKTLAQLDGDEREEE